MDKAFKSIKHGLEKDIKQYSHNMDKGLQMTDKDPERLFHLMGAMAFAKLLCMLEEMKEGGEKEGKGGMGGMMHAMGKSMGGQGGSNPMMAMMNTILPHGLPQIGFTPPENHHIGNVPYGNNQGGHGGSYGNYGGMENDMEMRRGRSSRTGRYVHRAEMNDGMNDNYDNNMNMDGRGGNSGGGGNQSNTGGNIGRR